MTSIDDKIKLFRDVVFNKIREEKKSEYEEIDKLREEKIQKLKEELAKKENEVINEASKKAALKSQEVVAKEKLNRQHAILKLKENMIDELNDALIAKLRDYVLTEEYSDGLNNALEKALSELHEGNYLVYVSESDYEKLYKSYSGLIAKFTGLRTGVKTELVKSEEDLIGGFIIENKDGRNRFDNSFATLLKDNRELIGIKVSEGLR